MCVFFNFYYSVLSKLDSKEHNILQLKMRVPGIDFRAIILIHEFILVMAVDYEFELTTWVKKSTRFAAYSYILYSFCFTRISKCHKVFCFYKGKNCMSKIRSYLNSTIGNWNSNSNWESNKIVWVWQHWTTVCESFFHCDSQTASLEKRKREWHSLLFVLFFKIYLVHLRAQLIRF